MAQLKRGSFLGDMYKVREHMIQRRKEKAEQEEREKAALAGKEPTAAESEASASGDTFKNIGAAFANADGQPTATSSVD